MNTRLQIIGNYCIISKEVAAISQDMLQHASEKAESAGTALLEHDRIIIKIIGNTFASVKNIAEKHLIKPLDLLLDFGSHLV